MNKIKQQFSDLRSSTPKQVQWLLMAAAFVIVLILLTLLVGGWHTSADDIKEPENDKLMLIVDPSETLDLTDTPVGAKETKKFTITASAPVKIVDVRTSDKIAGLNMMNQCSTESVIIDKTHGCLITVTYAPDAPMATTSASLFVDWRGVRETNSLKKTETIKIALGAVGKQAANATTDTKPELQPQPQPPVEPGPGPVEIPEPEPEPEPAPAPIPAKEEIKQEIEAIAPSMPDIAPAKPAAKATSIPKQDTYTPQPEACSDFAFPGYDASGRQIGWIKPERGAYYFHPFSDKNCDNPTGVYNPDNGIISDIDDASKKIGTDSEHIGYSTITNGAVPQLSSAPGKKSHNNANNEDFAMAPGGMKSVTLRAPTDGPEKYLSNGMDTITNSMPYDRSFILRQYKPIPATIVSDIRADVKALEANTIPVRATVDRNVYADNGRTVIIPTGTLLMGYVAGTLPGPYTSIGRMQVKWYQFILPNGVEFNFQNTSQDPFSADAQGRIGVPGRGSTDYLEQFVMPMLTAIVPAAVNMIAPVADKFVNQIDLDNNTVVQSGTVRSSELAKNEIITAWNQVAQKLLVDMMDNTTPPFSIPAGTRITVYSPVDLQLTCGDPTSNPGKKCAIQEYSSNKRRNQPNDANPDYNDGSWTGQVRSFDWAKYCVGYKDGKLGDGMAETIQKAGLDYSSVLFYCQSNQYKAINNAKQDALYQNQQQQFKNNYQVNSNAGGLTGINGDKAYNEQVLGLKYDDAGTIINPFQSLPKEEPPVESVLTCTDGTPPDGNGCCTGEIYTDMGDQGFNCCPETGGDCFPPIL